MRVFASELRYLLEIYGQIERELGQDREGSPPGDPDAWVRPVLENRQLLERVVEMDGRLVQLAREWEQMRERVPQSARDEVQALAAEVRERAERLGALCAERSGHLEVALEQIEGYLGEVRRGRRLLESLRRPKATVARFLDSRG